jgi:tetratricopeptide (TPR) repeat protein
MTRAELKLWASNNNEFWNQVSIGEIEKLIAEFPYFAPAHQLLAKLYYVKGHYQADKQTQLASLYAIDRPRLFELLHAKNNFARIIQNETVELVLEQELIKEDASIPISTQNSIAELFEGTSPTNIEQTISESIEVVRVDDITQIEEELTDNLTVAEVEQSKHVNIELETTQEIKAVEETHVPIPNQKLDFYAWLDVLNEKQKTNGKNVKMIPKPKKEEKPAFDPFEIIDRFIANDPRIATHSKSKKQVNNLKQAEKQEEIPKKEFYSPENMAQKSLVDEHEIVSETLAQLYAQQGNIQKAIRAYEKLQLTKPEKSTYFAALIEKLNHQP